LSSNEFYDMMKMIESLSESDLSQLILDAFKKLLFKDRKSVLDYFITYPFWGVLDLENGTLDALLGRVEIIKKHNEDIKWLYDRLADEQSKNVLTAILKCWIWFDSDAISSCTERVILEYYHTDIFPHRDNEVFVDIGAYTGDSVANFILTYGVTFKRIYCYEIAPHSFKLLKENLMGIPNIILREKAVGAKQGSMYIDFGSSVSSERISDQGETEIEVVCLDDDITEPVTFIKMDIEGAEKDALRGCRRHIKESKPNLAVCTYHGYDDIYAIPKLIDEIQPGYEFYLRYHGGNLIPTEFSLLAVWRKE